VATHRPQMRADAGRGLCNDGLAGSHAFRLGANRFNKRLPVATYPLYCTLPAGRRHRPLCAYSGNEAL
jgi:hypothetical protein